MKIINGNNIDILKQYPDNYFDAIVTDPPYGLGKEPNAPELMKDWIEKGYHEVTGSGFMGKEWDAFVPQPIFWKEVFRVLKHGGHVLSFFGTRTYDWGVMAMRFSGFEVRDCIQWLYGSGFPKSHNISKAIDKMYGAEREVIGYKNYGDKSKEGYNPYHATKETQKKGDILPESNPKITKASTEEAKQWEGWGSALKPANEPIVLARKPLEKGLSIAENVLKWGTGAINIDGCRVGTNDNLNGGAYSGGERSNGEWKENSGFKNDKLEFFNQPQGRFPANLILTHHEDCECFENENCNCVDDCPIKILDEQSGESKGTIRKPNGKPILNVESGWNDNSMIDNTTRGHNDKGGASRFFYVAKASKSERNKGLDGFDGKQVAWSNQEKAELKRGNTEFADDTKMHNKVQERVNFHPTVKPIKLMQYLVRLITPPNGIVLDPFCGSGTTGVACKLEGFQFVGLEQDAEYSKIAQARIDNYLEEKPTIKKTTKTETKPNQLNIF
jgi:site-specific DNA-methyltransferase (adenine-specific)